MIFSTFVSSSGGALGGRGRGRGRGRLDARFFFRRGAFFRMGFLRAGFFLTTRLATFFRVTFFFLGRDFFRTFFLVR